MLHLILMHLNLIISHYGPVLSCEWLKPIILNSYFIIAIIDLLFGTKSFGVVIDQLKVNSGVT